MKITPKFLKKIDRYLLINKPLVWRTRIHYLLFFSMVLNVFAVAITMVAPISKQNIPDEAWPAVMLLAGIPLLGFVGLYWAYTQYKYKLVASSVASSLLTVSLYGLGVAVLVFNLFFAQFAFSFKIAHTVDTATFEADYAYYASFNGIPDKLIADYGIKRSPTDTKSIIKRGLRDSLDSIKAAKEFIGLERDNDFIKFYIYFLTALLLFAPMVLLLTSFTGLKEIFIVAFSQLLFWTGASFLAWSGYGIHINYGVFAFLLAAILFASRNRNNSFIQFGHYLLISMISFFGISMFISIIDYSRHYTKEGISLISLLAFCFFFLALAGRMTSSLKAKPK